MPLASNAIKRVTKKKTNPESLKIYKTTSNRKLATPVWTEFIKVRSRTCIFNHNNITGYRIGIIMNFNTINYHKDSAAHEFL